MTKTKTINKKRKKPTKENITPVEERVWLNILCDQIEAGGYDPKYITKKLLLIATDISQNIKSSNRDLNYFCKVYQGM